MPKRSGTRTVLKKLPKKPQRLVTKAHRLEREENRAALDVSRRIIPSAKPGHRVPDRRD